MSRTELKREGENEGGGIQVEGRREKALVLACHVRLGSGSDGRRFGGKSKQQNCWAKLCLDFITCVCTERVAEYVDDMQVTGY